MIKKVVELIAPASGRVIPLEEIPDEVFSQGLMGPGLAIELDNEDWTINAPVDAHCSVVYPTGHAVALKHANGLEILIHIGIETYKQEGVFEKHVYQGQQVLQGQRLVTINKDLYPSEVGLVLFTLINAKDYEIEKCFDTRVEMKRSILYRIISGE